MDKGPNYKLYKLVEGANCIFGGSEHITSGLFGHLDISLKKVNKNNMRLPVSGLVSETTPFTFYEDLTISSLLSGLDNVTEWKGQYKNSHKGNMLVPENEMRRVVSEVRQRYMEDYGMDLTSDKVLMAKKTLEPGSKIVFNGDYHGSLHSLVRNIDRWKNKGLITDDFTLTNNVHIVFLGDLVDRSVYSVEVMYIVWLLKLKNWTQVDVLNGNHEDYETFSRYDFDNEIMKSYPNSDLPEVIRNTLLYLPQVLYLTSNGNKWLHCSHGGIDSRIQNEVVDFLADPNSSITVYRDGSGSGFNWSDFNSSGTVTSPRGCGDSGCKSYGPDDVTEYFNKHNIVGIIRGHQDRLPLQLMKLGHNKELYNYVSETNNRLNNVKVTVPLVNDVNNPVGRFYERGFLPVITLSSAVSPRELTHDCYAVLTVN